MANVNEPLTCIGYGLFAVTSFAVGAVNLTTGSLAAGSTLTSFASNANKIVRCEVVADSAIRYRLDGVAPTVTQGTPLAANTLYKLWTEPSKFVMLSQGAIANVHVNYLSL